MEPLTDSHLGLMSLLNRHDSFNLALSLLDRLLHVLVVVAHLTDQILVVVLLVDNGGVETFLNEAVDFESAVLVKFFEFKPKSFLLPAEKLFQLLQVGRPLNLGQDSLLNSADLGINIFKELVHGRLEGLGDDLGCNLVHVIQGGLVGIELLIEEILEVARHIRGKGELLKGLLDILNLIVDALIADQFILFLVEGNVEITVRGAVLICD